MNKKGFTLIELLAVIIILGILMIIAIPSVTKYISDSRKSAYVDTAKEIIAGARNLVNSGNLGMYDTDTTYYLNSECIKTENALKSPYGEFTVAYVVVNFDGKGYEYFWTSVDEAGQGISKITKLENLDIDKIESDLTDNDIPYSLGIDGRSKYMIIDKQQTNCGKGVSVGVSGQIDGSTGNKTLIFPDGKTKSNLVVGDLVKFDTEEFYVINNDGSNLTLLARYNLNVGNKKKNDVPEGVQNSDVRGNYPNKTTYGVVTFSSTNYWKGKVGSGLTYQGDYGSTPKPYVYDSNSNIYTYVNNYKNYLENHGLSVKEARLISDEEVKLFLCSSYSIYNPTCPRGNSFIEESSFWIGSAHTDNEMYSMVITNSVFYDGVTDYNNTSGVRPVIVV